MQIEVGPSVTVLLGADEPGAVRLAVEDVVADFGKVMGAKPKIVERAEDAGPVTLVVGEREKLPADLQPAGLSGAESFSIAVKQAELGGRERRAIVLSGADMRGTIYAVYQFSQEFLGVDPMYYWTDHEPARRARVEVSASLDEVFPAPVFKYRGFFLNDEDLLTGWAPGEKKDKTGISLAVWNKVYETILRLKGNMVVPGTWIFPDDPQVKLAGERGLILNQHHAIPLGLNVARWPKDVPYNYSTHPEILERAWKNAVAEYDPHQEILWSVGLRGLSDVSYASMDPSVRGNDAALGRLISKAIADQMGIVRAAHPNAQFVTDLWQEGARLMHEGYLKVPPEVTLVWADAGYGYMLDGGQVAAGQGAYYHVAMMNGRANQLSEMVPPERIYSEMGRYIKGGATGYFLVNTSDIRPVTMTTRAVMDIAWRGEAMKGEADADAYRRTWAAEEFGAKAAPAVAAMYKNYFQAPAQYGTPPLEYGDNLYHTEARRMMLAYMIDFPLYSIAGQAPKWEVPRAAGFGPHGATAAEWLKTETAREIQQCGDAQPRWDAVWQKALAAETLVEPSRREFYQGAVLTMIQINRESNRMLVEVSRAIEDASKGDMAAAKKDQAAAESALAVVREAQAKAEYGKWKNWYRGDGLTGVYFTQQVSDAFGRYLDDPQVHLPAPVFSSEWDAYYHIMHYEGDRSADVK
ncbi:hypothetical protein GCM10011507_11800 [Edaphobacter acidisoli]|uniref:Alpha glucuronidase N-terminal domain-containing protein n=1 Tax=Edaphobacter acidisoli TaxID=2040573 RepID=A0A916RMQ0_9BACT|nr:glycosyl hydrolase 115 family protein [Edaphobacter acidisoli]GGA61906.1 hypothetical protein GCM10011507_11800 [Edaphobacter acidisoli]